MKKWIIITTINEPSEAIIKYSALADWEVVVVGDTSTPKSWLNSSLKLHYISIKEQLSLNYRITRLLPFSSYMRKIIGYLYAIERGAEIIVDTDDDNIPTKAWEDQWNLNFNNFNIVSERWVNTYAIYGAENSWPRGIPLTTLSNRKIARTSIDSAKRYNIGIVQGLADGDPDLDAIYRLTNNKSIIFDRREMPLVLPAKSWTPINSQNTMFIRKFFPLLYLPSTVTFRSTDIIRGYVAQPILWKQGYNIAIVNAGVVQKRNPHNYLDDFNSEIPIYLHAERIAEISLNSISKSPSMEEDMLNIYSSLCKQKIVRVSEIKRLEAWLLDVQEARRQ